jgi:LysR family transcriptional regulator, nitrogen assimilation regulatory protein
VDTRYLRSFLRTADLRSISRAAESLGIAQPSLSQQLLRLEDEVGFKLFNRTARGVTVTEAGRIFQEHARNVLHRIDQALEDVREANAAASGQAIIALPYSLNRLIGVELVEAVLEHAPNTSVRLVESLTGNIRGWLDEGRIDLGVLYDLGPIRHLSVRPLVNEEMFLVGPSNHFQSDRDGRRDVLSQIVEGDREGFPDVPLSELEKYPLLTTGPQHGLRKFLDHEAARLGFGLHVAHEIDSVTTIAALVMRERGFSILPKTAIDEFLFNGTISIARIEGGAIRRRLSLVRNPSKVVTHASARVEDLTIKIMSSLIAKGAWDAQPEPALI